MEELTRDRDALRLASLMNVALVKPELLKDEEARLIARRRELAHGTVDRTSDREAAERQMHAMIARMRSAGIYSAVVGAN